MRHIAMEMPFSFHLLWLTFQKLRRYPANASKRCTLAPTHPRRLPHRLQVRNTSEVVLDINAAYIGGLQQVASQATRIVIMSDRGDEQARQLARSLNAIAKQVGTYLLLHQEFRLGIAHWLGD